MLLHFLLVTSLPVIIGKSYTIDVDLDDDLFVPRNDRYFYVMNGCTEPGRPESIVSMREDSKHFIRCCTNSGDLCISRIRHANDTRKSDDLQCQYLPQTYENAERVCQSHGLRLCTIEMKRVVPRYPTLDQNQFKHGKELCCTTGCNHDLTTMWTSIRDPCIPNPCQNGGICSDSNFSGHYSCLCSPDWTGSDCSRYNPPAPPPPPPPQYKSPPPLQYYPPPPPPPALSNSRLIDCKSEDCPHHFKYNCGIKSCFYTIEDASSEEKVGYYSKTIGDCNKCQHMCDMDVNCGGVECGQDYCIWWKVGECTSEEERRDRNWRYITCMKTDEPALPSATSTGAEITSTCPNTVNKKTNEITSPNYPNEYENNQYCEWKIQAPKNQIIELELIDIDLQQSIYGYDCRDSLIIYDSFGRNDRMLGGDICGNEPWQWRNGMTRYEKINSTNRFMFLVFGSDSSFTTYKRFKLSYRFKDDKTTDAGGQDKEEITSTKDDFQDQEEITSTVTPIEITERTDYLCSKPTCPFKNYLTNIDYGYYSYSNGDCESCKSDCTNDMNCGAVECGRNQCTWWRNGVCTTENERTWNRKKTSHNLQTCIKPDVSDSFECSKPTCPFKNYIKDVHYGLYNTGGDCYSCKWRCYGDPECGAVECGRYQCTWWAKGVCTTDDERTWNRKNAPHNLQTCIKTSDDSSMIIERLGDEENQEIKTPAHPGVELYQVDEKFNEIDRIKYEPTLIKTRLHPDAHPLPGSQPIQGDESDDNSMINDRLTDEVTQEITTPYPYAGVEPYQEDEEINSRPEFQYYYSSIDGTLQRKPIQLDEDINEKDQLEQAISVTPPTISNDRQLTCQDNKAWCRFADCSLDNVRKNCQRTCNNCP